MAEYIERDERYIKFRDAKYAIMDYIGEQTVSKYATSEICKAVRSGAEGALYAIEDLPGADVVEVVRCKECEWWDGMGWDGRCEAPKNGLIREYTNFDDFCSYGERKGGEGRW